MTEEKGIEIGTETEAETESQTGPTRGVIVVQVQSKGDSNCARAPLKADKITFIAHAASLRATSMSMVTSDLFAARSTIQVKAKASTRGTGIRIHHAHR